MSRALRFWRPLAGAAVLAAAATTVVATAGADGAEVTRGEFHTFAVGLTRGYDISGHAQMVRTADGSTIVSVHVAGLPAAGDYGVHVHAAPCATGAADGHYMFPSAVEGGATSAHNEIWPGPITASDAGVANGHTKVGATAGLHAVSVVVHAPAPDGSKIACADLQ